MNIPLGKYILYAFRDSVYLIQQRETCYFPHSQQPIYAFVLFLLFPRTGSH
jgi:hypothetical protein